MRTKMARPTSRLIEQLLLCLVLALKCTAQPGADRLEQARQRAREAQSRIVGRACYLPEGPLDCMRNEITTLRDTVRDYTLWKLNESGGDVNRLTQDLSSINDIYARETILRGSNGMAFAFQQKTTAGELLITINYFCFGAMAFAPRAVIIQGFRNEGGRYVFGAETGESVSGIMGYRELQTLQSPVSSEMWLLIGGQVGGFMGDLERARIYAFNGYEFRELWAPEDRQNMLITVKGDQIDAIYLGPRIYRRGGDIQDNMEERLQLTTSGVLRTELIDHGDNPESAK